MSEFFLCNKIKKSFVELQVVESGFDKKFVKNYLKLLNFNSI